MLWRDVRRMRPGWEGACVTTLLEMPFGAQRQNFCDAMRDLVVSPAMGVSTFGARCGVGARIAPPFMEATDASRLVCVVVVSYQEYSHSRGASQCEQTPYPGRSRNPGRMGSGSKPTGDRHIAIRVRAEPSQHCQGARQHIIKRQTIGTTWFQSEAPRKQSAHPRKHLPPGQPERAKRSAKARCLTPPPSRHRACLASSWQPPRRVVGPQRRASCPDRPLRPRPPLSFSAAAAPPPGTTRTAST